MWLTAGFANGQKNRARLSWGKKPSVTYQPMLTGSLRVAGGAPVLSSPLNEWGQKLKTGWVSLPRDSGGQGLDKNLEQVLSSGQIPASQKTGWVELLQSCCEIQQRRLAPRNLALSWVKVSKKTATNGSQGNLFGIKEIKTTTKNRKGSIGNCKGDTRESTTVRSFAPSAQEEDECGKRSRNLRLDLPQTLHAHTCTPAWTKAEG